MTYENDLIHTATEGNFKGLTKLEYFAAMFTKQLIGNDGLYSTDEAAETFGRKAAKQGKIVAKALITELNKQQ